MPCEACKGLRWIILFSFLVIKRTYLPEREDYMTQLDRLKIRQCINIPTMDPFIPTVNIKIVSRKEPHSPKLNQKLIKQLA